VGSAGRRFWDIPQQIVILSGAKDLLFSSCGKMLGSKKLIR
jgi:hypothetical protein